MEQSPTESVDGTRRGRQYIWLGFITYARRSSQERRPSPPSRLAALLDVGRSALTSSSRSQQQAAALGASAALRPRVAGRGAFKTLLQS